MTGTPVPAAPWIRVADARALAWHVEELLGKMFPDLRGAVLIFASLTSEFEVKEFEHSLQRGL